MKFNTLLFLCVANSARSQMAEALARQIFGDHVVVQSAGSTPSRVNPFATAVMSELSVAMDSHHSKSIESIDLSSIDLVITLCKEEVCPVLVGDTQHLHWPLPDPDRAHETISDEQRAQHFRVARDDLRQRLLKLQEQRDDL